jgi:DNA-binding response OmpR family regulator
MAHSVLIVDDEESVRRAWGKALTHAGYQVFVAGSAAQALSICDQHSIDVVLLDFIMPSVDGVRLLVDIRKRLPFVRSLIVSGKLDTDVSASELGSELKAEVEADMYLHKPLSNDDLRAALKTLTETPEPTDWRSLASRATKRQDITAARAAKTSKSLRHRHKKR